jgi:hypothetical protein
MLAAIFRAGGTAQAVAHTKEKLARSDKTVARFKEEIATRRRMMDQALRNKRDKLRSRVSSFADPGDRE